MAMATSLITLQDVVVRYGPISILQVPSLEVGEGETLAIIGPNGAGKSTLLRVMGLLQRPTRGRIYVDGKLAKRGRRLALRRRMASVMQEPLLVRGSVFDNAALGLKLQHVDSRMIERRVGYWLERLGIAPLRQRSVHSLSGGEAQRTSLVRALALEPALLLLDEPFSALDPPSQEGLLLDLVDVLREASIATVLVTHNRHEALTLGNRVGILINGEMVQIGGPAAVFRRPCSRIVAHLVGTDVMLEGVVTSTRSPYIQVTTAAGTLEAAGTLPIGTRVTLCLRPEDVSVYPLCRVSRFGSEAINVVSGTVAQITPWGGQSRVTIDSGVSLTALLPERCARSLSIQPGQRVAACFDVSAVHVIAEQ